MNCKVCCLPAVSLCAQCQNDPYCGIKCQKKDWKTKHQFLCKAKATTSTKVSKQMAGYITPPPENILPPPGKGIRCGTCKWYRSKDDTYGSCAFVDGTIHIHGCCNLYTLLDSVGLLPDFDYSSGAEIKKAMGLL